METLAGRDNLSELHCMLSVDCCCLCDFKFQRGTDTFRYCYVLCPRGQVNSDTWSLITLIGCNVLLRRLETSHGAFCVCVCVCTCATAAEARIVDCETTGQGRSL